MRGRISPERRWKIPSWITRSVAPALRFGLENRPRWPMLSALLGKNECRRCTDGQHGEAIRIYSVGQHLKGGKEVDHIQAWSLWQHLHTLSARFTRCWLLGPGKIGWRWIPLLSCMWYCKVVGTQERPRRCHCLWLLPVYNNTTVHTFLWRCRVPKRSGGNLSALSH